MRESHAQCVRLESPAIMYNIKDVLHRVGAFLQWPQKKGLARASVCVVPSGLL